MARRFTRGRFVRPAKATKIWLGAGLAAAGAAAGSATLLTTLNAAALALRPFTILRTRQVIHFTSDQSAVSEFTQGVYTKQIVTESAAAAGVASVPSGITESEADFFVYQPIFQLITVLTAVGFASDLGTSVTFVVDSKAMRKVGIDDQLVSVVELRGGTAGTIAIEGRTLIQLH